MPATIIQAPQAMPARHGLLDTVFTHPEQNTPGDRWENGFCFTPENLDNPESWVIPCVGGAAGGPGAPINDTATPIAADDTLCWSPFLVRAKFRCDVRSLGSVDFQARAESILRLGEQKLIETELYRGDAHGYVAHAATPTLEPNLTLVDLALSGGTDLSGGLGVTSPAVAIRLLVQAAAVGPHGARAMIHATPAVAEAWMQGGSIRENRDGKLETCIGGHLVVAGAGYTGAGPNNVAPAPATHTHWAWVTSPVYVLRGAVETPPVQVDRNAGDARAIVQRTAAVFWDGSLHAGLPVDITGSSH